MEKSTEYTKFLSSHVSIMTTMLGLALVFLLFMFPKLRRSFLRTLFKILRKISVGVTLKGHGRKLSPASECRLAMVKRKTLVLDMDDTMMKAILKKSLEADIERNVPFDYRFTLFDNYYTIFVYKRPHLDYFLDTVSQWYNVMVYTTATKFYADPILDFLDNGRGILKKRMYRHNCRCISKVRIKPLSLAFTDLSSVVLVDNSIMECTYNKGNAIKIPNYVIGSLIDNNLLALLPFLDCLRFVDDVRSILKASN
ncbi:CTD nuclear envelope phosphatase 1 [Drosophila subobscura]|uniref:CTD nuclear envelope phosphatase 1 n=1 Tax=Drosophila subobscura TaxID=7241 RepID=UPI00155A199B|nr:CTD nuclear envelope phosphatase 1 [Drosophila subobscura]